MLDHPTLDQLKSLRLDGMAEAFAEMQIQDGAAALSHAEWLGWTCHAYVPGSQPIYAAFRSKAKGLLPPSDE